jgi:P4 family phage/plasmid primase-like protien
MEAKIERLTVITKNLKTTNFIDNVMKECRGLFYNKDFIQKLDENHFLFSFKNGILDLKTGEFRDGRPDDFISLCCGVNYVKYSDTMPYLDDIKDFLSKVHPGENERRYMLSLISSLLEGHNADESFHLWTGTGGNGKSKVNELLIQALGDYAIKFPITLFTGKRGASNSVSPEVVESKGKRFAYLEEPSEGERINIGLMKEYSGGDKIKGRGLWSNFIEFKPQFKIILYCNDMPKVPADDMGTWRRIKVLEFLSCFVDNPKNPNEFKKDKYLSEKIPKWTETFMSMIVHNYLTDYKVMGGLYIPKEVEKFTEEYQKDMDIYIDFINTRLVKTDKKTDKISLQSLHDDFKSWYMMNYNCQKYPLKKDMKKYFEKKYGKANCSTTHILGFVKNSVYNEDDDD